VRQSDPGASATEPAEILMTGAKAAAARPQLPFGEFIALMAMMFATIAFSIDSMLPALPQIAAELTPGDVNRAQLILTSFVLGMGIGSFFTGPLSDAWGRKRVLMAGMALYSVAALLAALAQSLELVLAARLLQGLGAAGPRIVSMAMVRDLHQGRAMARVMSFIMMVFILVPAVAPSIGSLVIAGFGWRGLFASFVIFAVVGALWLGLRQPETLAVADRRPLQPVQLWRALIEVFSHRNVVIATAVLTLFYGLLFANLSSIQPIFGETFGRAASFPYWFAGIALCAGTGSMLNAWLVGRLGMRYLTSVALGAQAVVSLGMAVVTYAGLWPDWAYFPAFLVWTTGIFFIGGLTVGNLNALAMEPLGHIAGMAASMTSAVSTVLAVMIAAPIGLAFDGTPVPLAFSVAVLTALGYGLMRMMKVRPVLAE